MNKSLQQELMTLCAQDEETRAELVASGELFDGYHPRMAAVHTRNANALSRIVDEWGWPGVSLVGNKGAEAAWLVLQHSIGHPELQRRCLPLLQAAADAGDIPAIYVAYLEDRICCFEERPQRYGTQFDWDDNGQMSPLPIQDPDRVDSLRDSVGLGPLLERIEQVRKDARAEGQQPPADREKRQREKRAWARSVGWI